MTLITRCRFTKKARVKCESDSLTVAREAKGAQEEQAVVHPREQREAAVERIVPEKELEHGGLLVAAGPPVGVRHGELVQVGEERGDPGPDRPLHNLARVPGRRCHATSALGPGPLVPGSLGLAVLRADPAKCSSKRGGSRDPTNDPQATAEAWSGAGCPGLDSFFGTSEF